MHERLRARVCAANLALREQGLVFQTWGNASAVDREYGVVAIKPSGVAYDVLQPEDIPVVDMKGNRKYGELNPSVDLPSHLALYTAFPDIGGVVHTHSHYATCFAQAHRELPCFGTTHADYFHDAVPLAPAPTFPQVTDGYEWNTGLLIAHCFRDRDPMTCPAALVAGHGPFAWGVTIEKAVENAAVLEELAHMAAHTLALNPDAPPLEPHLRDKHFLRKHGKDAYYGQ